MYNLLIIKGLKTKNERQKISISFVIILTSDKFASVQNLYYHEKDFYDIVHVRFIGIRVCAHRWRL